MRPVVARSSAVLLFVAALSGSLAAQTPPAPLPYPGTSTAGTALSPLRVQREHEQKLIEHVREHLLSVGDGLALAADRHDLRVLRASAPPAPLPPVNSPTSAFGTAAAKEAATNQALEQLALLAELWDRRLNEGTPFAMMPRDRVDALARLDSAVNVLGSNASVADRERFVPAIRGEVIALQQAVRGVGPLNETIIERARAVAAIASSGRPAREVPPLAPAGPASGASGRPYAGGSPASGGSPAGISGGYLAGDYRGSGPGGPGRAPYPMPTPGSGSGTAPLPPAYQAYAEPSTPSPATAASPSGASGPVVCFTKRKLAVEAMQGVPVSDGFAKGIDEMLNVAECWSNDHSWPGWSGQMSEAYSWAVDFAVVSRDCGRLETIIRRIRAIGPRPGPFAIDSATMVGIAAEADEQRRWVQSRYGCSR